MTREVGDKPSNIASYNKFEGGDIESDFADADVVVERASGDLSVTDDVFE